MSIYDIFCHLHSGIRWILLVLFFYLLIKAIIGVAFSKSHYHESNYKVYKIFLMTFRLQMLVGLVLYFFLSPITKDLTFDMNSSYQRFFSIEHGLIMTLSILIAEIAQKRIARNTSSAKKYKILLIYLSIALVLLIFGIPDVIIEPR